MRTTLPAAAALVFSVACADAPITAADIQADGQLRPSAAPQGSQSVLAASEQQPKAQRAEHLRVTGLLAGQAEGALADATRFSSEGEAIYLHLRADELSEPRPVTFVWTHAYVDAAGGIAEHRRETMGFLQPTEIIDLAASLPLARYAEAAEQAAKLAAKGEDVEVIPVAGEWTVEVYSTDANGRSLVFERDFEVLEAEAYESMLADAGAGVSN